VFESCSGRTAGIGRRVFDVARGALMFVNLLALSGLGRLTASGTLARGSDHLAHGAFARRSRLVVV
jgi:hypothetical protein